MLQFNIEHNMLNKMIIDIYIIDFVLINNEKMKKKIGFYGGQPLRF